MKSRTPDEFNLDQSLYLIVTLFPYARNFEERKDMLKQFDSLVAQGADIYQVDDEGHLLTSLVDRNKSPALYSHIKREVDRRIMEGDYPPETDIEKVPDMNALLNEVDENFKLLDKMHDLESRLKDFSADATGKHAVSVISALLGLKFEDLSKQQRDSLLKILPNILETYSKANPDKYKLLIDRLSNTNEASALVSLHAKIKENDILKVGSPSSKASSSTASIAVGLNPDNARQSLGDETRKRRDRSVAVAPLLPTREPDSPTHSPPTKKIATSVAEQSRETSAHPLLDKIFEILAEVSRDPDKAKGDLFLRLNKNINEYNNQENKHLALVIPVVGKGSITFPLPPKSDYDAHKYAKSIATGIKDNYSLLVVTVKAASPEQERGYGLKK